MSATLNIAREFVARVLAGNQIHLVPFSQTDLELEVAKLLERHNGSEEMQKLKDSQQEALDDAYDDGKREQRWEVEDLERELRESKALVHKLRTEPNENQLALLEHQRVAS